MQTREQGTPIEFRNLYYVYKAGKLASELVRRVREENLNALSPKKSTQDAIEEFRVACREMDEYARVTNGKEVLKVLDEMLPVLENGFSPDFSIQLREGMRLSDIEYKISAVFTKGPFFDATPGINLEEDIAKLRDVSVKPDLYEALNSLRVGLGTASIFHQARCLELVTGNICKRLRLKGINPRRGWQDMCGRIDGYIKSMPEKTASQSKKRKKLAALSSILNSIRLAWRNDVMHAGELYTEEEARKLFDLTLEAVRAADDL